MEKIILIKYADLVTKKDNRKFFIRILKQNIKSSLDGLQYEIKDDYFRMFIFSKDIEIIKERLHKIFGIYEIVEAYKIQEKSIDNIKLSVITILESLKFNTFKVVTNRSDKSYPVKSMDVSREIGSFILKSLKDKTVDVHTPDMFVNVEIRQEGVYLSTKCEKGLGGYPTGTLGNALMMISGGIDSPVASYLSIKRGIKLDFLYFESIPHTSLEARDKVRKLCSILSEYNMGGRLFIVPLTKMQEAIYKNAKEDYIITLLRRSMYRIAAKKAIINNYGAIINGESVGQVASQTLSSMKVINEVTNFPILRPLCSFDKLEIIEIAKKIGTYETSILPYEDCCTIFVPKHPVINPVLKIAIEEEKKIDIENIEKEIFDNIFEIKIEEKNFKEYL